MLAFVSSYFCGAWLMGSEGEISREDILKIVSTNCFDCHGHGASEGNIRLDDETLFSKASEHSKVWWQVLKNVRARIMPPASESRLTDDEIARLGSWIKTSAFGIVPENPDPGRPVIRRLNRSEYANTVRDLMGIPFDAELLFPPDDSGHGFDNMADAMTFSPMLLEKHLQAAQMIVAQAVPTQTWVMPWQRIQGWDVTSEDGQVRGSHLDGKKFAKISKSIRVDEPGQYRVQVHMRLHGSFEFDPARYNLKFLIGDEVVQTEELGWDENKPIRWEHTVSWEPGEYRLALELEPIEATHYRDPAEYGNTMDPTFVRFELASILLEGPLDSPRRVHPDNYGRFFPANEPPSEPVERRRYAEEVIRRFATRAYRGRVDAKTVDRAARIAESVYAGGKESFEAGMARAMVGILASPRFIFRAEAIEANERDLPYGLVDELTLASRLSYFLWSTMPDETLMQSAEQGRLRQELDQQIKRMLDDQRANSFIRNFVGQWLRTRDVTQTSIDILAVTGNREEFDSLLERFRGRFRRRFGEPLTPEEEHERKRFFELRSITDRFDDELKQSMRRETEMCFESIVRQNRSLLEMLDADYTFLNEKLANHYGISGIQGKEMRRVELPPDSPRGGVLTHASMLLVTSNPTRTSPVKRGLFVLDNILGTPAPPAPGNVPELEDSSKRFEGREPTLRELLAAHRESSLCSSCHARMDPLGLALENFNAIGAWREQEKGQAIDPSGVLITGESFSDVRELKRILREEHAEDFYRCVTQKLITYAMGRGIEPGDEHAVDLIVEELKEDGGRFHTLLEGIVHSAPFQKMRSPNRSMQIASSE